MQQKSLPTFSHQEKQQAILKKLHAEAIYDAKTEVSYVFRDTIPSDMDTLAVAARHNIFFAHNDGLLVEIYGNEDNTPYKWDTVDHAAIDLPPEDDLRSQSPRRYMKRLREAVRE